MDSAITPLARLMRERNLTQDEVAKALGVSRQAVQRWKSGLPIKVDNLKKLAKYLGVSVSTLTGETPASTPAETMIRAQSGTVVLDGYTRVPVIDVLAGCGRQDAPQEPEIITGFIDIADWFLRTFPGVTSISHLTIVPSTGDSMEPTIAAHSLVIVDENQTRVNRDGIYCIRADDQLIIKRIQRNIDGTLTLISDNKRYEPMVIAYDVLERTTVIGRVVYCFNGNAF